MHGSNIRMFISWLRHIVKSTAFRSCRSLLSVLLRLIRHCQSVVNGKDEDFRERPGGLGLALSSQPATNQFEPTPPVSLAVPLLEAPLQSLHSQGFQPGINIQNLQMSTPELHGGSNHAAFNTDSPPNSILPLVSSSNLDFSNTEVDVTIPLLLAAPGQTPDITLTPIVPDEVNRYKRDVRVKDEFEVFLVEKGPLDCSEELAAVEGWEPLTHPEGSLFFYHPYKRVFTDADVRDPETAVKLGKAVEKAYEEARNANIFLHSSVELALELIVEKDKESWGYYFADHERRVIFWSKDHKSDSLMNKVRGVERKSHIKYALNLQYWRHIQLFPNKRFLPEDVVVELKELVMHAQTDYILLQSPLIPFTVDQVTSMLGLIDSLMNNVNKEREHSTWIAAILMKMFCRAKFKTFCGQPGARLIISQASHGKSNNQLLPISFRVINVFLFGVLQAHRQSVNMIWVDKAIIWPRWSKFRDRLTTEWNGYALFSTVMLAVNISFLAVPSVTNSFVIDLVYMSTVFTIGSLVSTLFLVGQVNDSLRGTTEEVAYYVHWQGMQRSALGLDRLALMLSLPLGLLSWGMTLFTLALLLTSAPVIFLIVVPIIFTITVLVVMKPTEPRPDGSPSFREWCRNTERRISCLWPWIKEQVTRWSGPRDSQPRDSEQAGMR